MRKYKILLFAFICWLIWQMFRIGLLVGTIALILGAGYYIYKLAKYVGRFMKDDKHYYHR